MVRSVTVEVTPSSMLVKVLPPFLSIETELVGPVNVPGIETEVRPPFKSMTMLPVTFVRTGMLKIPVAVRRSVSAPPTLSSKGKLSVALIESVAALPKSRLVTEVR